jgi:filamentous hemagglutinin family protein
MFFNSKLNQRLFLLSASLILGTEASAQITPDGSTSTTVTIQGDEASPSGGDRTVIQNGQVEGNNLFHSFSDFSLPNGGEAAFDNAATIENIISRVTGGRISNINGLISANGTANLFLINPAGIVFGDGASLQIGGSFLGSTADSVIFPDSQEFSANSKTKSVLTVNAPIGLGFRENPVEIQVQGANLTVGAGQSLTLLGGNISLDSSNLAAQNGQIVIGGLAEAGTLNLNENLGINITDDLAQANISFSNGIFLNVAGNGSGAIAVNGNNIQLAGNSVFNAGIDPNQSAGNTTPGNIAIAATGDINLNGNSIIRNNVAPGGTGNVGSINLSAANIFLNGDSRISSTVQGEGNTNGVTIDVGDRLALDGSEINARVVESGVGNAGNIQIQAKGLTLLNDSAIFSQTLGNGNAGSLSLNVTDNISLANSFFQSQVAPGGTGNASNVTINAGSLTLDGGKILADSNGIGDAGNVVIDVAGDVSLDNDTIILSKVSEGEGDAGNVNVNSDRLLLDGRSFIISNTGDRDLTINSTGNAGNVNVNSRIVTLNNFSQITSNALSNAEGQPGNVQIDTDTLTIAGGSNVNALTENNFDGGTVTITAENIDLNTGGKVVTGTNGAGNGGSIVLNVAENININGENAPSQPVKFIEQILQDLEPETGLFANATDNATGDGGSLQVDNSEAINVFNGGTISVASEGTGNGGSLFLQSNDLTLDNQGVVEAFTNNGTGGNIKLQVADVIFMRESNNLISAQAANTANGGNLTIDTNFVVALPNQNNDILATAEAGDGGNINITAESLLGIEERASQPDNSTNDIDASSEFGLDGQVSIFTPDVNQTRGATELDAEVIEPQATVSQICSAQQLATGNSLSVRGKGGIPIQPIEPLIADEIFVQGNQDEQMKSETSTPNQPILTAQGYIYPAQGAIVKDNGDVILYSNSPAQVTQRQLLKSRNCL